MSVKPPTVHKHKWRFDKRVNEGAEYKCHICGERKIFPFVVYPRQIYKICRAKGWNTNEVKKVIRIDGVPCSFCLLSCYDNQTMGYCKKCNKWSPVSYMKGMRCAICGTKVYKVVE